MTFLYDKDKTREVCRSCGSRYHDFYYADKSGMCDDCLMSTGHLGLTNLPQSLDDEAKRHREIGLKAMFKK